MPKNPRLVERQPPVGVEIAGDVGTLLDRGGEGGEVWIERARVGEGAREGVGRPGPDLEQREVDRGQAVADRMRGPAGLFASARSK